jgi:hypothetical protein
MGRQSEPEILSELPIWSADEPSNPIPQPSIAMFSDKDESAVAGLLALGTSTTDTIGPEISLSEFTISPPARERSLAQVMAPINFTEYPVAFSPGQHQLPQHTAVSPEMTPTETLELLRHYRYEVAPWVRFYRLNEAHAETDICSWTYVISVKYSESKACSWRWYRRQSGITCSLSPRHL